MLLRYRLIRKPDVFLEGLFRELYLQSLYLHHLTLGVVRTYFDGRIHH
jgi:hypothetical protein